MTAFDEAATEAGDRLEQLADEFAARLRNGERPTVAEYVDTNPELAAELQELLPPVLALEELKTRHLASSGRIGFLGLPTDRLGEFRIVREIGRGGMGIVYEAEQESLGRLVALKTLPHAAFLSPTQVERFQREAETASKLLHPNIVPIHSVGADAGVHFFAMPRIDGVALDRVVLALQASTPGSAGDGASGVDADPLVAATRSWIEAPGEPRAESWRRIAEIGAQAADALEFAHRHGVLHRDVKPSNVLLEPAGKVWVTDFGIAKVRGDDGMTRTGEFLGTLQYSPPEQLDGTGDARGDVYGLGLCLFELAVRRPAFHSNSRRDLANRIRNGVPRSLRQIDRTVPRDLEIIVAKATAFDPDHRYQSAAQLAEDLRHFAAGRPIAARDVSPIERLWRWSGRNPVTATFAASTVFAAIVAAGLGWYGYLSTNDALARERLATQAAELSLEQARTATTRAETNLTLSLRSLNQLFDGIAEDRSHGELAEPLLDMPMSPSLSHKEIDLLRQIVTFYEEFAAQNASDAALRLDTARALRRIGDLHQWTGAIDDAEAAYQSALGYYDDLANVEDDPELVIETAAVTRNLGSLAMERGQWMPALRHFEAARRALADEVDERPTDRNRRELVCALNTIAAALSRQVITPRTTSMLMPMLVPGYAQAASRCKQALTIAETLVAEHPESPTDLLLLARCHRLNAQTLALAPDRNRPAGAIERSMQVLTELAESQGDHAGYQYELAEANCLMGAVSDDPRQGLQRCRDGVQQARDLTISFPAVPSYLDLLARGLRRRADTLVRCGEADTALRDYELVAQMRSELRARFPFAPHHVWELANVYQSMARLERQLGHLGDARTLLESAIAEVQRSGVGSQRYMTTFMLLPGLYEDLGSALEALGDTAAVELLRSERSYPRGWGPPGWPSPADAAGDRGAGGWSEAHRRHWRR